MSSFIVNTISIKEGTLLLISLTQHEGGRGLGGDRLRKNLWGQSPEGESLSVPPYYQLEEHALISE